MTSIENIKLDGSDDQGVTMSSMDIETLGLEDIQALRAFKKGSPHEVRFLVVVSKKNHTQGSLTIQKILSDRLISINRHHGSHQTILTNYNNSGAHNRQTIDDFIQEKLGTLTAREKQILQLIGEGHRNKAIAEILCRSLKTIDTHRLNIMRKLDTHNAVELAHWYSYLLQSKQQTAV